MFNTNPGCRRCFLSCGRSGKIRDPSRFLFCCDICRTFGYTDCDQHGCGDSKDGGSSSPNDPIGDFIGNLLDPKGDSAAMICCDQLTKGQILDMTGRELHLCQVCNRPNPNKCTLPDADYQNLIAAYNKPVIHNYVYFQSDVSDGIQSCQGLLTGGPVPNLLGRGNPNGPDGYVYNHAIGGGVLPNRITDKYLDQDSNVWYGFHSIIEFIPTVGNIIPNIYVFKRKFLGVLDQPPNITGHSTIIDSIFQATNIYGMSGWTLVLSALDKNPYNLLANDGWVYGFKAQQMTDNNFFDTYTPLDVNEKPLPTFLDGIVKGQWMPIDIILD